ncbi:hypothetical protein [Polymorphospora rubra]|uniref:hypothetical protein n=1 Tax=Polymorphospora rubra TaxID=338584 RepID=UPI001BB3B1F3|nr:hypothetical protein [Polymorphospora rubra]
MTTWNEASENTDGIGDGRQHAISSQQFAGALALLGSVDPVCAEVLARLNLRVYPGDATAGDRTAYVVLDVHGVSIGVKRRAGDLYLHADTTETPDEVIAFEINGGGEIDHPTR